MTLAAVAIGLTLVYVGMTTLTNYFELRVQRKQMAQKGELTGLVLQRITGVTKLRVSGAEPHAFRVWEPRARSRCRCDSIRCVRTTLNISDDVLLAVRERARREGRSAGEVLSDLAREALQRPVEGGEIAEPKAFYGFEPLPHRGPAVSNELVDRLRDEEDV